MLRILLIDDDHKKIKRYLELLGEYTEISPDLIDTAASIEEAQKKLSSKQYDLAILDLYLPLRYGDDPSPENAIRLLKELQDETELNMPYNIVGITRWKDADSKYKEFFDLLLLAYIVYEEGKEDWKKKLRNKVDFLLKAQRSVQLQDFYNYDVAIINALQTENLHILRVFGKEGWNEERIPADMSTTYYTKTIKLKNEKTIRIVTCYALQMASTASAVLATKLIYNFRPKYLFMTGIAAGVDREEVHLGDILVASKVWDGASGKIKTNGEGIDLFMPDFHELPLDTDMQAIIKRLSVNKALLNSIEESYENVKPQSRLNLHLGPIASVPAVLSSSQEVQKIKEHCRKLLGVEMEGYGVFYAAHNTARPRPKYVVLIKSVSDYADPDKSDNYQDYCMHTSAMLAKHLIEEELTY
jgi:nucleoside phosphorylase